MQATLDRFEVLSFDVSAAEYYGALASLVRQYGRNPRPRRIDLQVAAIARGPRDPELIAPRLSSPIINNGTS